MATRAQARREQTKSTLLEAVGKLGLNRSQAAQLDASLAVMHASAAGELDVDDAEEICEAWANGRVLAQSTITVRKSEFKLFIEAGKIPACMESIAVVNKLLAKHGQRIPHLPRRVMAVLRQARDTNKPVSETKTWTILMGKLVKAAGKQSKE